MLEMLDFLYKLTLPWENFLCPHVSGHLGGVSCTHIAFLAHTNILSEHV